MLEGLGQTLIKARSGAEALRCLLNQDFAVILLDVQMPDMNGFETATLIRQRERSCHTPIIFLTAFNAGETAAFQGYALGAVDYLMKPVDPVILTSKVAVFVDLFKKTLEVQRQAMQLAKINEELRRSEERFRSLSACSPIGIFLTDIDGHCIYTNPNCQEICGFRLEDDWQAGWEMAMYPDDRDRILADWMRSMHRGLPYSTEFRMATPDGTVQWVYVHTSPMVSDQGQFLGHVGILEDITERKQAEVIREQIIREQTARQQAEAANRIKDEFLAIVSHELRTPLNSILGWSRLLLERDFDTETTHRALETIYRNATSQTQLIEDLLDVTKLMQGKLRLSMRPINLMRLINAVLETICPLAEAKSIQLEKDLNPAAQMVIGDSARLQQVILNLLSNAIKFTPEKGQVWIKLSVLDRSNDLEEQVKLDETSPADPEEWMAFPTPVSPAASEAVVSSCYAQLTITDSGIGISPDFLPHVFDRFRQADNTTTRAYGGLGLGLAVAYHLVKLHGGEIYAYSEGEAKGSTFTVNLPLAAVTDSAQPSVPHPNSAASQPSCSLAHVKVLVAEDHADTREFITLLLQQAGAQVAAVASVAEALQVLEHSTPQVLVSDIGMPGADGYDLIRAVKAFEAQHQVSIPAIALTAYTRHEDRLQTIAAGFQRYIAKPIEPKTLIGAIAQLVNPQEDTNADVVPAI